MCCRWFWKLQQLQVLISAVRKLGLPVIVDGFISSVAALCAVRMNPQVIGCCLVINRLNMDIAVFYRTQC